MIDREQKLVDLCFEIALLLSSTEEGRDGKKLRMYKWSNEKKAEWIAKQLRCCGFDTKPIGASWGVLI